MQAFVRTCTRFQPGTVSSHSRSEPHPSDSRRISPIAALSSRAQTGSTFSMSPYSASAYCVSPMGLTFALLSYSCPLPQAAGCNAISANNRTQQPWLPQPATCPYLLSTLHFIQCCQTRLRGVANASIYSACSRFQTVVKEIAHTRQYSSKLGIALAYSRF